ncbi:MAG: exo-alpha-sialidase [Bacteroidetes bacterium]|nr:exo-alpha-sialidase [Bacteroidota bacterium]
MTGRSDTTRRPYAFCFLLTNVFLFLGAYPLHSQWNEESILFTAADSAKTGYTHCRNIVAQGELVHTIWMDTDNGKWRPTYRRSTDGGNSWEEAVHIAEPNTRCPQYHSSLAVQASTVYVVWSDERTGESQVYLRISTDNGESWEEDSRITPEGLECSVPAIVCEDSIVHVVYSDRRTSSRHIKYIRSVDGGAHWTEPVSIADAFFLEVAAITAVGSVIHTCWYDYSFGNLEIFYRRSTDGGVTWENSVRLTEDPGVQNGCTIAASGDDVHVAWHDRRTGFWDIHYCYSWDGGAHWGMEEPVMVTPDDCYFPTLAVSGQTLHLAWVDTRNDPGDIYYCRSEDAGCSWGLEEHVVSSPLRSRYPFLAVSGDVLHMLWTDDDREIRSTRNPTGNAGATASGGLVAPTGYSLDQNYPNPFTAWSNLQYSLSVREHVRITLHDMLGRELRTLLDDMRNPGTYTVRIDGTQLSPGSYLCRMTAGKEAMTRLITVMHQ